MKGCEGRFQSHYTNKGLETYLRRGVSATINTMIKKSFRNNACQAIARIFYNNAICHSMRQGVKNVYLISQHENGFKPTSEVDK